MRSTTETKRAPGVERRRGGVEAVDVGQQHQQVAAHHGGDARRQPVIVAVADFRGGDRVVLVDDGHRLHLQQRRDGGARVEIAAALLGVAERHQDLAGIQALAAELLRPGAGQRDLADGGGGLAFLEPQRALAEAEHGAAERDGARGDDQDLRAGLDQCGNVVDQRAQPVALQPGGAVDQQGGADLDGDAAVGGEGAPGHGRPRARLPLVVEVCTLRRPPLSCRTSPPQGGRSDGRFRGVSSATLKICEGRRDSRSPPLRGRCPAGQRGATSSASIAD